MFTYKFFVKKESNNSLTLRLRNNNRKTELYLGMKCTEAELEDAMRDCPRGSNMEKRRFVQNCQAKLEGIRNSLFEQGRNDEKVEVIREMIQDALFGKRECEESKKKAAKGTFVVFFNKHLEKYDRRSTRESNEYTLSVMRKFTPDKLDSLNFEDINYAWLSDFENYMKKAGLSQNTRKIHFGNIRTAMREAYKRELTEADPFRRFTFRPAKTRKRSLTVEELRALFDYPVEPFAELYRDMMKLSFMLLGINTVDLYNLREIKNGRIEYDRSKTGGLFSVKVEPEAMEIINRYKGEKGLLSIADRWSDHRNFRHQLNSAIKRIGKAQGKGKKDKKEDGPFAEVTSYWMRHTWGTIAYELGVSDDTISQALGHQGSGARVTEVYIRRNMDMVDEANRRVLDWVLYGRRDE